MKKVDSSIITINQMRYSSEATRFVKDSFSRGRHKNADHLTRATAKVYGKSKFLLLIIERPYYSYQDER